MDTALFLLLGLIILAIIVGAAFLRRWLNRSATAAGERAGRRFAAEQVQRALSEFGTTLRIHAPATQAQAALAAARETRSKDFLPLDGDAIGIRFVEQDDTVIRLIPDGDAMLLRVETFREYMGFPQTAPLWKDLRARVTAEAEARGVRVTEGPATAYTRGPLLDDRNARWSRDA